MSTHVCQVAEDTTESSHSHMLL